MNPESLLKLMVLVFLAIFGSVAIQDSSGIVLAAFVSLVVVSVLVCETTLLYKINSKPRLPSPKPS
jgi:hypothetical protein